MSTQNSKRFRNRNCWSRYAEAAWVERSRKRRPIIRGGRALPGVTKSYHHGDLQVEAEELVNQLKNKPRSSSAKSVRTSLGRFPAFLSNFDRGSHRAWDKLPRRQEVGGVKCKIGRKCCVRAGEGAASPMARGYDEGKRITTHLSWTAATLAQFGHISPTP